MKKVALLVVVLALIMGVLVGCTSDNTETNQELNENIESQGVKDAGEVNLYTDRHYDTDEAQYNLFTKKTGIKVNVVKGKSDELIERLVREGEDTQDDLLITADAGRLFRAKDKGLLQKSESGILNNNIPENLRDKDNNWFGLTLRGRVIVYSLDRVNPEELSTYEDLTNEKWNGEILVRSSSNIYNQSLLASIIAIEGEDKAKEWAKDILDNMARDPQGNDRGQATAVVAQNSENAIKLMEFLSGEEAQKEFAEANYEYPVNPNVEPSDLLKSWGDFKAQDINLSLLGEYNQRAVEIFNEIGWK